MDDLRDMFCSARCNIGAADSKSVSVLVVLGYEFLGKLINGDAVLAGTMYHFVVNVGEVLDKRNVIAFMFKPASEHVKHDEWSSVSDVEEVIDCRAARIEADVSWFEWSEGFFFAGEVVE